MAEITDEQLHFLLGQAAPYTVVLLRWGPRRDAEDSAAVIWEHGRRMASLRADGIMPIVCQVGDDELAGVGVLTLGADEALDIMDGDPGVRAGVLAYELHACRSFPGSMLPSPAG